jgi:hypothetical protein
MLEENGVWGGIVSSSLPWSSGVVPRFSVWALEIENEGTIEIFLRIGGFFGKYVLDKVTENSRTEKWNTRLDILMNQDNDWELFDVEFCRLYFGKK